MELRVALRGVTAAEIREYVKTEKGKEKKDYWWKNCGNDNGNALKSDSVWDRLPGRSVTCVCVLPSWFAYAFSAVSIFLGSVGWLFFFFFFSFCCLCFKSPPPFIRYPSCDNRLLRH